MRYKTASDVAAQVRTVASLPVVFEKINRIANDPSASLGMVSSVIADDVGLSARLLKLVNSAYFGFPSRVENVTQACVVVGIRQIRQLVLATSVVEVFKSVSPDVLNMRSFWLHSTGCAMASRLIAMTCGTQDLENFFVAGLLHDVGRLVMLQAMAEETGELIAMAYDQEALTHELERAAFGFTHAEVGGELLKIWGVPPSLVDAVSRHHHLGGGRSSQLEASAVHLADIIVHALGIGQSGNPFVPPLDEQAWSELGLAPEKIDLIVEQLDSQVEELGEFFCGDLR